MKRLSALLVIALLALTGCGKSSSSSTGSATPPQNSTAQGGSQTHFAKTKFVLHAGLAFGAFHRYIYKPFRAGKFSGPIFANKLAKLKGALAAAFSYHEIRLALDAARSSRLLSRLLSPLLALQTKLSGLKEGLKRGDSSQVAGANSDAATISGLSRTAGQPVSDLPTPQLGG